MYVTCERWEDVFVLAGSGLAPSVATKVWEWTQGEGMHGVQFPQGSSSMRILQEDSCLSF